MGQEAATRRGWRLALAGAPAPVVAPVLVGILAGAVVFFGAAVAQSLITGLALGVLVDLRGGARVLSPRFPRGGGCGSLCDRDLARPRPRTVVAPPRRSPRRNRRGRGPRWCGAASFSPPYLSGIGVATPPLLELLISGSQSTATFAFLGLVIGSIVVDRRDARPITDDDSDLALGDTEPSRVAWGGDLPPRPRRCGWAVGSGRGGRPRASRAHPGRRRRDRRRVDGRDRRGPFPDRRGDRPCLRRHRGRLVAILAVPSASRPRSSSPVGLGRAGLRRGVGGERAARAGTQGRVRAGAARRDPDSPRQRRVPLGPRRQRGDHRDAAHRHPRPLWVAATGAVYVVLMALSRTYLGAHWITDTVGGALLGVAVGLLAWTLAAPRLTAERERARSRRAAQP